LAFASHPNFDLSQKGYSNELILSGGNARTFRRITDLLVQEYNIDPQQIFGETEHGNKIMTQLEAIQAELQDLKLEIQALKKLIKPK
jgi:hypothetical protein